MDKLTVSSCHSNWFFQANDDDDDDVVVVVGSQNPMGQGNLFA